MQRPSDHRTSHSDLFSPYRHGDRKWEDYLLDGQTLVYDAAREQVEAIESAGRVAADQYSRQQALLHDFIASAGAAWDRVDSQLDTLTEQMVTRFSSLS